MKFPHPGLRQTQDNYVKKNIDDRHSEPKDLVVDVRVRNPNLPLSLYRAVRKYEAELGGQEVSHKDATHDTCPEQERAVNRKDTAV